jgi:pyrroloquinoline quinone biosynthesis protein B
MARPAARLTAIVLGAAAGGGYPQWNCRCPVCRLAWDGDPRVSPRTQASLAVSGDGAHWILFNAAPDLRAQIAATAELRPACDARGSPIAGVVLTGGEIDQVAGLLNLRERQPFDVFATAETIETLDANAMFEVLARDVVARHAVALDTPFELPGGLEAELFAVPGKVPLYMEAGEDDLGAAPGGNVGLEVRAGGARLAFVPGAAMIPAELAQRLARADVVLFDGTLFADDEMIRHGLGAKTGRRMGHMPIDGEGGSLAALSHVPGRRVYIHLNNTNPVLVAGSPERRKVEAAGWEVAADGLKITV